MRRQRPFHPALHACAGFAQDSPPSLPPASLPTPSLVPKIPAGGGGSSASSSFMASWTCSQKAENLAVWAGFLLSATPTPHSPPPASQLINIQSRAIEGAALKPTAEHPLSNVPRGASGSRVSHPTLIRLSHGRLACLLWVSRPTLLLEHPTRLVLASVQRKTAYLLWGGEWGGPGPRVPGV